MSGPLFVDSWGWIVLANQQESLFGQVKSLYQEAVRTGSRIVTTDYILDEVITFLFAKAHLKQAVGYLSALHSAVYNDQIHLERISLDRFEKAWQMRVKYRDHPKISFTDFTSFVVMREVGIFRVLTEDDHFEQIGLGFTLLPVHSTL